VKNSVFDGTKAEEYPKVLHVVFEMKMSFFDHSHYFPHMHICITIVEFDKRQ